MRSGREGGREGRMSREGLFPAARASGSGGGADGAGAAGSPLRGGSGAGGAGAAGSPLGAAGSPLRSRFAHNPGERKGVEVKDGLALEVQREALREVGRILRDFSLFCNGRRIKPSEEVWQIFFTEKLKELQKRYAIFLNQSGLTRSEILQVGYKKREEHLAVVMALLVKEERNITLDEIQRLVEAPEVAAPARGAAVSGGGDEKVVPVLSDKDRSLLAVGSEFDLLQSAVAAPRRGVDASTATDLDLAAAAAESAAAIARAVAAEDGARAANARVAEVESATASAMAAADARAAASEAEAEAARATAAAAEAAVAAAQREATGAKAERAELQERLGAVAEDVLGEHDRAKRITEENISRAERITAAAIAVAERKAAAAEARVAAAEAAAATAATAATAAAEAVRAKDAAIGDAVATASSQTSAAAAENAQLAARLASTSAELERAIAAAAAARSEVGAAENRSAEVAARATAETERAAAFSRVAVAVDEARNNFFRGAEARLSSEKAVALQNLREAEARLVSDGGRVGDGEAAAVGVSRVADGAAFTDVPVSLAAAPVARGWLAKARERLQFLRTENEAWISAIEVTMRYSALMTAIAVDAEVRFEAALSGGATREEKNKLQREKAEKSQIAYNAECELSAMERARVSINNRRVEEAHAAVASVRSEADEVIAKEREALREKERSMMGAAVRIARSSSSRGSESGSEASEERVGFQGEISEIRAQLEQSIQREIRANLSAQQFKTVSERMMMAGEDDRSRVQRDAESKIFMVNVAAAARVAEAGQRAFAAAARADSSASFITEAREKVAAADRRAADTEARAAAAIKAANAKEEFVTAAGDLQSLVVVEEAEKVRAKIAAARAEAITIARSGIARGLVTAAVATASAGVSATLAIAGERRSREDTERRIQLIQTNLLGSEAKVRELESAIAAARREAEAVRAAAAAAEANAAMERERAANAERSKKSEVADARIVSDAADAVAAREKERADKAAEQMRQLEQARAHAEKEREQSQAALEKLRSELGDLRMRTSAEVTAAEGARNEAIASSSRAQEEAAQRVAVANVAKDAALGEASVHYQNYKGASQRVRDLTAELVSERGQVAAAQQEAIATQGQIEILQARVAEAEKQKAEAEARMGMAGEDTASTRLEAEDKIFRARAEAVGRVHAAENRAFAATASAEADAAFVSEANRAKEAAEGAVAAAQFAAAAAAAQVSTTAAENALLAERLASATAESARARAAAAAAQAEAEIARRAAASAEAEKEAAMASASRSANLSSEAINRADAEKAVARQQVAEVIGAANQRVARAEAAAAAARREVADVRGGARNEIDAVKSHVDATEQAAAAASAASEEDILREREIAEAAKKRAIDAEKRAGESESQLTSIAAARSTAEQAVARAQRQAGMLAGQMEAERADAARKINAARGVIAKERDAFSSKLAEIGGRYEVEMAGVVAKAEEVNIAAQQAIAAAIEREREAREELAAVKQDREQAIASAQESIRVAAQQSIAGVKREAQDRISAAQQAARHHIAQSRTEIQESRARAAAAASQVELLEQRAGRVAREFAWHIRELQETHLAQLGSKDIEAQDRAATSARALTVARGERALAEARARTVGEEKNLALQARAAAEARAASAEENANQAAVETAAARAAARRAGEAAVKDKAAAEGARVIAEQANQRAVIAEAAAAADKEKVGAAIRAAQAAQANEARVRGETASLLEAAAEKVRGASGAGVAQGAAAARGDQVSPEQQRAVLEQLEAIKRHQLSIETRMHSLTEMEGRIMEAIRARPPAQADSSTSNAAFLELLRGLQRSIEQQRADNSVLVERLRAENVRLLDGAVAEQRRLTDSVATVTATAVERMREGTSSAVEIVAERSRADVAAATAAARDNRDAIIATMRAEHEADRARLRAEYEAVQTRYSQQNAELEERLHRALESLGTATGAAAQAQQSAIAESGRAREEVGALRVQVTELVRVARDGNEAAIEAAVRRNGEMLREAYQGREDVIREVIHVRTDAADIRRIAEVGSATDQARITIAEERAVYAERARESDQLNLEERSRLLVEVAEARGAAAVSAERESAARQAALLHEGSAEERPRSAGAHAAIPEAAARSNLQSPVFQARQRGRWHASGEQLSGAGGSRLRSSFPPPPPPPMARVARSATERHAERPIGRPRPVRLHAAASVRKPWVDVAPFDYADAKDDRDTSRGADTSYRAPEEVTLIPRRPRSITTAAVTAPAVSVKGALAVAATSRHGAPESSASRKFRVAEVIRALYRSNKLEVGEKPTAADVTMYTAFAKHYGKEYDLQDFVKNVGKKITDGFMARNFNTADGMLRKKESSSESTLQRELDNIVSDVRGRSGDGSSVGRA